MHGRAEIGEQSRARFVQSDLPTLGGTGAPDASAIGSHFLVSRPTLPTEADVARAALLIVAPCAPDDHVHQTAVERLGPHVDVEELADRVDVRARMQ